MVVMFKVVGYIFLAIMCFTQCQNVDENTLIASPNEVNPTKFPYEEYAYAKTYSMNRTWDLDSLFFNLLDETASNDTIFDENALVGDLWIGEYSIYNSEKKKAKTAQLIKKLSRREIIDFQNIAIDNEGGWMQALCVDKFRDAIVFYDNYDKPVGWINFCFSCGGTNRSGKVGYLDFKQNELRQFFISLGHPILEDEK